MFNATVDQNPTIPVSDGAKNRKNSPPVWNLLGELSTGPKPPALLVIQKSNSRPTPSIKGAPTPSSTRIVSIPRHTTAMLSSQNAKKQTKIVAGFAAVSGQTTCSMDAIACPPIHV